LTSGESPFHGGAVKRFASILLVAALGLVPVLVRAGSKSYRTCRISNGQIFSCDGTWYQGNAVVEREDHAYHTCKISNGQVFSCDGSWFQGEIPVYTDR
jgi:hypothetical protein